MARRINKGLEYLPLDLNFFQDRKVRRLQRKCDADAPMVYIALLCTIYKEGYYVKWDEDFALDLADAIHKDEDYVNEVMNACFEVGLLSEEMFSENRILTSVGIQNQYNLIGEKSKRKSRVNEYSLLDNQNKSEEMGNKSELIPINSDVMQQSKVKESKVKKSKVNSFSSFSSLSVGNEELQEEQQEEIILSNFVFLKNIPNPQAEYKKFIAYNNTGGRVWNKMSLEEKDAALELWKQKPAQKERFDEEFKGFWQKIYSTLLSIDAPPEIRMDALSDGVNYTLMNGRFTIHCTSRLSTFIERNLDHFKGYILDYLKAKHCNGYTIHYFEIPVQNT